MLLRSSSTPILGSLLSSAAGCGGALNFSDSPSSYHHYQQPIFSDSYHNGPASSSAAAGFRRANSEGDLRAFLHDHIEPLSTTASSCSHHRGACLETIPAFSVYHSSQGLKEEMSKENTELMRTVTIGESISEQFGFTVTGAAVPAEVSEAAMPPLFLARGLGIDRLASGLLDAGGYYSGVGGGRGIDGGGNKVLTGGGGGGWEQSETEMYYKRMVEEDPGNALLLSNYAQFLYETKGDLKRAEEYYSRAVLADPRDGEILSSYAKLVWELHHDEERAASYFERAVEAAPNDSHVLAAHAGFLWETEEENAPTQDFIGIAASHGIFASASA